VALEVCKRLNTPAHLKASSSAASSLPVSGLPCAVPLLLGVAVAAAAEVEADASASRRACDEGDSMAGATWGGGRSTRHASNRDTSASPDTPAASTASGENAAAYVGAVTCTRTRTQGHWARGLAWWRRRAVAEWARQAGLPAARPARPAEASWAQRATPARAPRLHTDGPAGPPRVRQRASSFFSSFSHLAPDILFPC
jgi:hypothetical protein